MVWPVLLLNPINRVREVNVLGIADLDSEVSSDQVSPHRDWSKGPSRREGALQN
jgi:hypothetical protein